MMRRDDDSPDVASPPAFAAGWAADSAPPVPLESMRIDDTPAGPAPEAPPVPPVALNWADAPPAERFDIGSEGPPASAPVIASALLEPEQQDGLRYLMNYANKSIRKNRSLSEQDHDDLLQDIYMEWWICTGFEVAALPKLLQTDSPERQSLRESIYRVFGRYRYRQTAHRTADLNDGDAVDAPLAEDARDFALDMNRWLDNLPDLEAKIIDLYYFQHKTMDEIGAETGLAKQRVSEIHQRALAKHPDKK